MSDAVLRCEGVNKHYGGVHAVVDVTLEVRGGEILGLIGPNGAGKTTLVDILGGEQDADSGTVTMLGEPLRGSPAARSTLGLARTFQHPQLADELTAAQNIIVGLASKRMAGVGPVLARLFDGAWLGRPEGLAEAEEAAASLNLGDISRPIGQLTIGELKLVEVARALVQQPEVVLLDEPFAGMDARGVEGVSEALEELLRRDCGVLVVDHNIDIVADLVHRIVLMDEGATVFDGPPDECLRSEQMQRVYFGVTREAE
jgi:branched-chain amino acid transport system ATP-binding protein